jgi:hypothetical protein
MREEPTEQEAAALAAEAFFEPEAAQPPRAGEDAEPTAESTAPADKG